MINNRQAGRRRGRGGRQQRSRGGNPGRQDNGNRIDNRARGNAAQLLEKYKKLARDAQMQGDRVNTEYYLQFADHYFRVLSRERARFEEQNPKPRRSAASSRSTVSTISTATRIWRRGRADPRRRADGATDRETAGNGIIGASVTTGATARARRAPPRDDPGSATDAQGSRPA